MSKEPTLTDTDHQKLLNIQEKMMLARHIIHAINADDEYEKTEGDVDEKQLIAIVHKYTGLGSARIKEAIDMENTNNKTYKHWYKHVTKMDPKTYQYLRNAITDLYTNQLTIPNKANIIATLAKSGYETTAQELTYDLKKEGFIWKKLGDTNKYVVIEEPEQMYERLKYLTKMKEFRAAGRFIFHVKITKLPFGKLVRDIVLFSPVDGPMTYMFPADYKDYKSVDKYIVTNILPKLPKSAVIVIEEMTRSTKPELSKHKREFKLKPTVHSSKIAMIKWLKFHGIPYSPSLHRAELYSIIEKNPQCQRVYNIGDNEKFMGHEVLYRPGELSFIGYFFIIENKLMAVPKQGGKFQVLLDNIALNETPKTWFNTEKIVVDAENRMLEEDERMELLLVKLLSAAKSGQLREDDYADCEESISAVQFIDSILAE